MVNERQHRRNPSDFDSSDFDTIPPKPRTGRSNSAAKTPPPSDQGKDQAETTRSRRNLIHQVIAEKYKIVREIQSGGMGTVYEAKQRVFASDGDANDDDYPSVALKTILPERIDAGDAGAEDAMQRFVKEARTVALLNNRYVCRFIDAGKFEGMYYLVMDLAAGGSLADVHQRLKRTDRQLSVKMSVRWMRQAALGLKAAQALKPPVFHRDVKPGNLLLTAKNGDAMLADFGIAKERPDGSRPDLTGTGLFCGSPTYASPEQMAGQVGPKSDIYSLGITFFHLLTGDLPPKFKPEAPRRKTSPIPDDLAILIKAMIEPDEEDRPSLDELIPKLRAIEIRLSGARQSSWLKWALGAASVAVVAVVSAIVISLLERPVQAQPLRERQTKHAEFVTNLESFHADLREEDKNLPGLADQVQSFLLEAKANLDLIPPFIEKSGENSTGTPDGFRTIDELLDERKKFAKARDDARTYISNIDATYGRLSQTSIKATLRNVQEPGTKLASLCPATTQAFDKFRKDVNKEKANRRALCITAKSNYETSTRLAQLTAIKTELERKKEESLVGLGESELEAEVSAIAELLDTSILFQKHLDGFSWPQERQGLPAVEAFNEQAKKLLDDLTNLKNTIPKSNDELYELWGKWRSSQLKGLSRSVENKLPGFLRDATEATNKLVDAVNKEIRAKSYNSSSYETARKHREDCEGARGDARAHARYRRFENSLRNAVKTALDNNKLLELDPVPRSTESDSLNESCRDIRDDIAQELKDANTEFPTIIDRLKVLDKVIEQAQKGKLTRQEVRTYRRNLESLQGRRHDAAELVKESQELLSKVSSESTATSQFELDKIERGTKATKLPELSKLIAPIQKRIDEVKKDRRTRLDALIKQFESGIGELPELRLQIQGYLKTIPKEEQSKANTLELSVETAINVVKDLRRVESELKDPVSFDKILATIHWFAGSGQGAKAKLLPNPSFRAWWATRPFASLSATLSATISKWCSANRQRQAADIKGFNQRIAKFSEAHRNHLTIERARMDTDRGTYLSRLGQLKKLTEPNPFITDFFTSDERRKIHATIKASEDLAELSKIPKPVILVPQKPDDEITKEEWIEFQKHWDARFSSPNGLRYNGQIPAAGNRRVHSWYFHQRKIQDNPGQRVLMVEVELPTKQGSPERYLVDVHEVLMAEIEANESDFKNTYKVPARKIIKRTLGHYPAPGSQYLALRTRQQSASEFATKVCGGNPKLVLPPRRLMTFMTAARPRFTLNPGKNPPKRGDRPADLSEHGVQGLHSGLTEWLDVKTSPFGATHFNDAGQSGARGEFINNAGFRCVYKLTLKKKR